MTGYMVKETVKYVAFMMVAIGVLFVAALWITSPNVIDVVLYLPR